MVTIGSILYCTYVRYERKNKYDIKYQYVIFCKINSENKNGEIDVNILDNRCVYDEVGYNNDGKIYYKYKKVIPNNHITSECKLVNYEGIINGIKYKFNKYVNGIELYEKIELF